MTIEPTPPRPSAWSILAQALAEGRCVRAQYHGHDRLLCPHPLGWKNGRAKVLAYQAAGSTSTGSLPQAHRDRWRTMFVDEIHDAIIVSDAPWQTADNYSATTNGIDRLELCPTA
jgi:hypothetical protein